VSPYRRVVNLSSSGAPDPVWIPYLPAEEPWEMQAFPLREHARYIQRLGLDEKGRLVEWVVIQSRWRADRWWQVAVYDTHKNIAHVHLFDRREQRFTKIDLRPITCYKDVEESLDDVLHYLIELEGWQENERRSDCGR
jgi:hypothetical protein